MWYKKCLVEMINNSKSNTIIVLWRYIVDKKINGLRWNSFVKELDG